MIRTQGKGINASFSAALHFTSNLESRGNDGPISQKSRLDSSEAVKPSSKLTHSTSWSYAGFSSSESDWERSGNRAVSWGGREGVSGMWSILSSFLAHFCKLLPLSLSENNSEFIPGFPRERCLQIRFSSERYTCRPAHPPWHAHIKGPWKATLDIGNRSSSFDNNSEAQAAHAQLLLQLAVIGGPRHFRLSHLIWGGQRCAQDSGVPECSI